MPYGPFKWIHYSLSEIRWISGLTLTLATQLFFALREWSRDVDWDFEDSDLLEYSQLLSLNHLPVERRVVRFYEVAGAVYTALGRPRHGRVAVPLEEVKIAVREVCQRYRYAF
jgi:hypothetical protein